MNSRLLTAFLALTLTAGCVVYPTSGSGGGSTTRPPRQPSPGDVTFNWGFAGLSCAEVPQIKSVVIDIPGEELQNLGVYPCLVAGYPSVVLHDFAGGNYSFNIEARGYGNERLYVGSGTFTVDGSVRVSVDLTPVNAPSSYAYVSWRFPANQASNNPSCQQAGISFVDVRVDDGQWARFDCAAGMVSPGVQTPFMAPGTHSVELVALAQNGFEYYSFRGNLQTFSGAPVAADYTLAWAVGGAAVQWQLTDGSRGYTCSQAGIQTMYINFQDAAGNMVYGTDGDVQSCDASPIVYSFLQPGTYRVYVQGVGSSGARYLSNANVPPTVTVAAGRFVTSAEAVNVQLFRAQ